MRTPVDRLSGAAGLVAYRRLRVFGRGAAGLVAYRAWSGVPVDAEFASAVVRAYREAYPEIGAVLKKGRSKK